MISRVHKTLIGETGAMFSECETYRYRLWRRWGDGPWINFLMLNPSTADDIDPDPTVTRCINRAKDMGFGGLYVTNLFAIRATDPAVMLAAVDPIGPENDRAIAEVAFLSDMVICAWGGEGSHRRRAAAVETLLRRLYPNKLHYLKWSAKGRFPWHPLYVGYEHKPIQWVKPAPTASTEAAK